MPDAHHFVSRKLLERIDNLGCTRGIQFGIYFECFVAHLLVLPYGVEGEGEAYSQALR